jgi:hypothetical protein
VETSPTIVRPQNPGPRTPRSLQLRLEDFESLVYALFLLVFLGLSQSAARAGAIPSPWMPLFKGIDHAVGTNDPNVSGNFSSLQVVRCVRVDLTDPDVRLFSTPQAPGSALESRETLTLSVPHFLAQNQLQVACDANFYYANPGGSDPTSEGLPCDVFGLEISSGTVVSAQTTADAVGDPRYASVLFATNNRPSIVFVNLPPGTNTTGIYTAITGYYPIVSNGVNIASAAATSYPDSFIHQAQPRTAYGLSRDNRYLYLMTIDGRQSGYSDGASDTETAYWMMQFGGWNAVNMDGGGSTALYMADSTGNPVALNHSSYLAGYGRERYIGSHFGVYAKPLPGFINDVIALPDDTTATVTWITTNPATSLVQYGLTSSLGSATDYSANMVTNHAALLTGLTPGTGYYFQVFSSDGVNQYSSANFHFVTANYASTNLIFDFTNVWTYATTNLDGVNWTAPGYDDSGWDGFGPALLWVDNRGPNANPSNIPLLDTQMGLDPVTGYPFITYYLRTHFAYTNQLQGVSLLFNDAVDDGAVFYLNGAEIYRLRMALPPTVINNSTLAAGYPCSGDASCPDSFVVAGDVTTNLVVGDNVLAAEVHNYNALSPDITFGIALSSTSPYSAPPPLTIQQSNSTLMVSWSRGGFTLQRSGSPAGPWVNVPGPIVSSPFTVTNSDAVQYFRLIK